jgi:hypothetical protein
MVFNATFNNISAISWRSTKGGSTINNNHDKQKKTQLIPQFKRTKVSDTMTSETPDTIRQHWAYQTRDEDK